MRSQCNTVTRVNAPFFFPFPLSFGSDTPPSVATLLACISRRGHPEQQIPHLLPDNGAALPHPFRDVVVVYSKPLIQQLILFRRVRPLSPSRQHDSYRHLTGQHLHGAPHEPAPSSVSLLAPTPRTQCCTGCLRGLSGVRSSSPGNDSRERDSLSACLHEK
jgi:hypothetical protein